MYDTHGNTWPSSFDLCPVCRQPDSCGDCNHAALSPDEVREIGGLPPISPKRLAEIMSEHTEFSGYSVGDDNDGQLVIYTSLHLVP